MIDFSCLPETGDFIAHDVFVDWSADVGDSFVTPEITGIGLGTVNIRLTVNNPPSDGSRLYAIPYTYLAGDDAGFGSTQVVMSVIDDPDGQSFSGVVFLNQTVYLVAKLVFTGGVMAVSGAVVFP